MYAEQTHDCRAEGKNGNHFADPIEYIHCHYSFVLSSSPCDRW